MTNWKRDVDDSIWWTNGDEEIGVTQNDDDFEKYAPAYLSDGSPYGITTDYEWSDFATACDNAEAAQYKEEQRRKK